MRIHTRRVRAAAVALLAALSLTLTASAQAVVPAPSIRIDNFARVNDSYFRGGQPARGDYADLANLGVKTVINLIGDSDLDAMEQSSVEQHGMHFVRIPMSTRKAPTAQQLETFLSIVNDAQSQPVYVHCVGGQPSHRRHDRGLSHDEGRHQRSRSVQRDEALQVRT